MVGAVEPPPPPPPPPPPQLLVQPPPPVVTVTVTEHCPVVLGENPPLSVTVPVYVVVVVGETDFEPETTGVTEPTPLLMLKVPAFAVVHESVDESPA